MLRAAQLLRERSHATLGARITLEKRIPVAAGMAGGSGNAAAALLALNKLWGLDWPRERLWALAQELGGLIVQAPAPRVRPPLPLPLCPRVLLPSPSRRWW